MLSGKVPHSACQGRDNAGVRTRAGTASGRTVALKKIFKGGNEYQFTITSANLYAIYTMWCSDNAYKPLAARTVSMTLKKHADELGLEHDNHIQNALGKRVNGFWGIEALVTPPVL